MELTPVESSHVAAIGYLEADRVLLVRYRDGALYGWPNVSAEQFVAMKAAPSKGRFLQSLPHGVYVSQRKEGAERSPEPQRAAAHVQASGPLNSIDEDAGKCCRKALSAMGDRLAPWDCPECGLRYEAQMVGTVRHWHIVPQVVILR